MGPSSSHAPLQTHSELTGYRCSCLNCLQGEAVRSTHLAFRVLKTKIPGFLHLRKGKLKPYQGPGGRFRATLARLRARSLLEGPGHGRFCGIGDTYLALG